MTKEQASAVDVQVDKSFGEDKNLELREENTKRTVRVMNIDVVRNSAHRNIHPSIFYSRSILEPIPVRSPYRSCKWKIVVQNGS